MKKVRNLFALAGIAVAALAASPAAAVTDENGNVVLVIITDSEVII